MDNNKNLLHVHIIFSPSLANVILAMLLCLHILLQFFFLFKGTRGGQTEHTPLHGIT